MAQKVYLRRKSYIIFLGLFAVWIFGFIVFWFMVPWDVRAVVYLFLAGAFVVSPLAALMNIEKVVLDKDGVTFQRRLRPITLPKITDLEVRMSKRKEIGLKIVGLDMDGKTRTIHIAREGEIHKRWDEFKEDLQKFK